jgi:phosphoribosyl 1,2-cyclic phosphate phosphodiesterase
LSGVKVWVVDAVREAPHPTHAHLEQTLEWIARVGPERAFLTHMNHMMDYATLTAKLPPGVRPAHDGLVIEC